jgi:hypothetical protein
LQPFSSENAKFETCRTIILPVAAYVYETWSLNMREEYRQSAFESREPRRIFGSKIDEKNRRLEETT